jgi:hypothetical protein
VIDNPLYYSGRGKHMAYKRTIDLMDESLFPGDSRYVQKKNPKVSMTIDAHRVDQTNEEIVDFVVKELFETLGDIHELESD